MCGAHGFSTTISSLNSMDVLSDGLLYVGIDLARQVRYNIKRKFQWFKAFYGVEPPTTAPFFVDIKNEYPDIVFKDCLMIMNWFTIYDVYIVLSARWKYCEEYIGSKLIEYGMKMAKVARRKIILIGVDLTLAILLIALYSLFGR